MKGGGVEHMKKHLIRGTVLTAIGVAWFYNYFIVPRDKLYAQFWGNPDFEKDMDERFKRQRAAGIFDQKFNVMLDDDEMTLYQNAPMPLDEYIARTPPQRTRKCMSTSPEQGMRQTPKLAVDQ